MDNRENDKACPVLGLSMELLSCDPGEKSGPQLSQQNPAGKKKKRNITAFQTFGPQGGADNYPGFSGMAEWSTQNTTSLLMPCKIPSSIHTHTLWAACPTSHFCQQLPFAGGTSASQKCQCNAVLGKGGTHLNDGCAPWRVYSCAPHTWGTQFEYYKYFLNSAQAMPGNQKQC